MSNLQTQPNKVIRALPNATVLCTVMVIITLKIDFDWKSRLWAIIFARWSYYFGYHEKWFHIRKI